MIDNVSMGDTKKMLRAVINGQSAMKSELITKIDAVEKNLGGRIDGVEGKLVKLEKKMDGGFKKVNERIDKLGKSLAYLEDDTPTRDELDDLTGRVDKIEKNFITV